MATFEMNKNPKCFKGPLLEFGKVFKNVYNFDGDLYSWIISWKDLEHIISFYIHWLKL